MLQANDFKFVLQSDLLPQLRITAVFNLMKIVSIVNILIVIVFVAVVVMTLEFKREFVLIDFS
jgi:hypothetical protein